MKFTDYYEVLGIARTATAAEIKQAYRKLAHQYHPDVSKDPKGEEKFKEIGAAYATLKDTEKRLAYDQLGQHAAGESFTPPPGWQPHWQSQWQPDGQQEFHADASSFDNIDLSDLFAAFSGRGSGTQRGKSHAGQPRPGQDYEVVASVTLEQIFAGEEIEVHAALPEHDASGLSRRVARTFRITLPKAAADGQRLRLQGQGEPGFKGGRPGDLYVALAVQPHALYRVSGRDLYLDLPLAPWEAVLGSTIQIPTLAGAVELKIKAGTGAGQKLRLAKRGLAAADGSIGTLYAVVQIVVPNTISPAEHKLYEELAQLAQQAQQAKAASSFNPRKHFVSVTHSTGATP
jgi:curved DNA-binding protein